ncbi:glycerophosphodiester phosphodiesterase family protein [Corynebacterium pseudodiphtheriticum]|uniref:glycerophosphodiester phosphodiesterase family protein n=1 Tax=Corynebacterium pseudodiphtheriticum TaxID=37637 RepID=UPI002542A4D7|nr:glycerophosphodiester phosphodiesterase family protein [Corynebacterium pseudodiphtheriticum]MDK4240787.1 glycerophosphodiester phosphodiesterase family protein [Corynebacterium pseudodiphtheriticum]
MTDNARILGPRSPRNSRTSRRRGVQVIAALGVSAIALAGCSQADDAADAANNAADSASEVVESVTEAATTGKEEKLTFEKQQVADLDVQANPVPAAAAKLPQGFDLQSHRFGRGEWIESSREGLVNSLKMGVTTLEFDIELSADGVPVVWHDTEIDAEKCQDTKPVTEGDPQFPYVGKLLHDLTFEQLSTLNCNKNLDDFPDAAPQDDNRLLQLSEVFEIAADYPDVHFNIETKLEPEDRSQTASPQEFVDAIMDEVEGAGVADRTMIQSFDWASLPLVRERDAEIPLVLLWDETTWKSGSAWIGDVDYDAVDGDIVEAAKQLGVQVLSPGHAVPYGQTPCDDDYHPVATPELITQAHKAGMAVVPWTVNDEDTMREQIAAGVDGLITDYPSKGQAVLQEK